MPHSHIWPSGYAVEEITVNLLEGSEAQTALARSNRWSITNFIKIITAAAAANAQTETSCKDDDDICIENKTIGKNIHCAGDEKLLPAPETVLFLLLLIISVDGMIVNVRPFL